MLVFEAKEVEQVGKIGSETFEKWYSSPGIKKIYATPNKYIEDGFYVVATVNGIKYLVLFECKEEYLVNLVNFTGKTVIPFCTSATSDIGDSGKLLAQMAGTGEWLDGKRFAATARRESVEHWVKQLSRD